MTLPMHFYNRPDLPRSIYEVMELKPVQLNLIVEITGFTGVRLAWTIVPKAGTEDSELASYMHSVSLGTFNGAANIFDRRCGCLESAKPPKTMPRFRSKSAWVRRTGPLAKNIWGGNAPCLAEDSR